VTVFLGEVENQAALLVRNTAYGFFALPTVKGFGFLVVFESLLLKSILFGSVGHVRADFFLNHVLSKTRFVVGLISYKSLDVKYIIQNV